MNSVRMVEFKQELEDLMSEHECLSINLIASQLNIHINKGKFFQSWKVRKQFLPRAPGPRVPYLRQLPLTHIGMILGISPSVIYGNKIQTKN